LVLGHCTRFIPRHSFGYKPRTTGAAACRQPSTKS
jgi:hypothetical protein